MAGNEKVLNTNDTKRKGIVGIFRELKAELKRITWPTWKDVKKSSLITVVFCLILLVIISIFDYGFSNLYRLLFVK
ncbi:MAG: preprotein translocase subunit SecE [Clostridiaceae bacterium]